MIQLRGNEQSHWSLRRTRLMTGHIVDTVLKISGQVYTCIHFA